ncbi:MAG: hypothetical protein Pars2KO_14040 [Parasphingorhabdus sp.]
MVSLTRSLRETWTALKSWPDAKQSVAAIKVAVPSLAIIAGIGFLSGWLHWYPQDRWQEYVKAVLVGLFLIALPFELVFRGVLLSTLAQFIARWAAWISTLLFVIYFPIYGILNETKWNGVFQMPSFWIAMLVFGIILSHIRIRSGSLWTVILIHGFAVATWMAFLGGRSY